MIYTIIFICLVIFAVYAFIKTAKKKQKPFPVSWHPILLDKVLFYKNLNAKEQEVFKNRMMLFFTEVTLDSVKVEIKELDRILIAASAVIPVFGFKEWSYNNLSGIILYPDTFDENLQFNKGNKSRKILGMVGNGRYEKQMIISKNALHQAFLNDTDKHNTPVHEFVHLLDKMDGKIDGVPKHLLGRDYIKPWLELMHKEMEAINNDESDIRKYGGTSQAEFFAVVSEYFFEKPKLFKRKHPELYKMLSLCFQQPKNNKTFKQE